MSENEVTSPKTAKDLLPLDRLEIGFHGLARFQLRQGISMVEAAEQLRTRIGESILIKSKEKGPKITRHYGRKGNQLPQFVFEDVQEEGLRYIVRKTDRGEFFLATVLKKEDIRPKKPRKKS